MLLYILFFLLLIASFKKILFWTGLWQNKEYRLDRLLIHLHETNQGRTLFASSSTIWGTLIVVTYIFVVMFDWFFPIFQLLVVSFLLFYVFDFGKQIIDRKVKKPVFTAKALCIVMLSMFLTTAVFFFPLTDKYLWTLLLLGGIPLLVAVWVFAFSFPSELYADYLAQKAQRKIRKFKKLTVIAVSGSYGKSSTKEAIATVLSQKYSVVKTPLSNNTPIGIAKTILKKIDDSTEFFIVEVGAYKIGELAYLCSIVKPDISITTSVSDQHISLYGSFENVIASEREVIQALPKDGLALFNANDKGTQFISDKTKQKKLLYKTVKEYNTVKSGSIIGYDITTHTDHILFSVSYKDRVIQLRTNLLGEHVVENILPAIFLGIKFDLTDNQIQKGIASLTPLPHTMQRVTLKNGIEGIDDTFNASPESVVAATEFLSLFSKRKFFVLTPLIELGKGASEHHKEIGSKLAHLDYILVTNKNYYHEIEKGVLQAKGKAVLIYGSYQELTDIIKRFAKKGDCVVFEGKESGVVLRKLV